MPSYSPEFKEQAVKKMMPPQNHRVSDLSVELSVAPATLYRWKNEYRAKGFVVPSKKTLPDKWDSKAKLAAVIKTRCNDPVKTCSGLNLILWRKFDHEYRDEVRESSLDSQA